jgi:hypothetical protein
MPRFTYTGDQGRYYPTLGLAPETGQAYELTADPGDGRWQGEVSPTVEPAPLPTGLPPTPPSILTTLAVPVPEPTTEPAPAAADTEGGEH